MGRIRVVNFMSLDGVIQSVLSADEDRDGGFDAGGWVPPYVDDTVSRVMAEATTQAAGLVLGRRTYDNFAAQWPHASESEPAVAAMNRMPKYLVSRTRTSGPWQNTIAVNDVPGGLSKIKQETAGDLVVFGSGDLLQTLLRHQLVDEFCLLVFPLVIGTGKKMFPDGTPPLKLRLTNTEAASTGVVIQTYVPG